MHLATVPRETIIAALPGILVSAARPPPERHKRKNPRHQTTMHLMEITVNIAPGPLRAEKTFFQKFLFFPSFL